MIGINAASDFPFSRWVQWTDRKTIANGKRPGVYILAKFDGDPPDATDPICREVIYVGETVDQSLLDRWNAFNRAAFRRMGGHSGGLTFASTYFIDSHAGPPAWLCLAALPVELDEPHKSAFIRLIERQLLWNYVKCHGCYPVCNRK